MKLALLGLILSSLTFATEIKTGFIIEDGFPVEVQYTLEDGHPIIEGDVLVDVFPTESEAWAKISEDSINEKAVGFPMRRRYLRKLWSKGIIPYEIDPELPNQERIAWAAAHLLAETGLMLVPRDGQRSYVYFKYNGPSGGCNSHIGRKGGRQIINLPDWCGRGSVVHEVLHAAGFHHEQTRRDRNDHLIIHWDNIEPDQKHNFRMKSRWWVYSDFDTNSIMLYGSYAFAIDRTKPTITTLDGETYTTNRQALSEGDKAGVRTLYKYEFQRRDPKLAEALW